MSAILGTQSYKCYFNQQGITLTSDGIPMCGGPRPAVQGGITAAMPAGSWLGAILSGLISERLGRKKVGHSHTRWRARCAATSPR